MGEHAYVSMQTPHTCKYTYTHTNTYHKNKEEEEKAKIMTSVVFNIDDP